MVGVNLISPVNDVVLTVTTPTYSSSIVSLTGVLPIIFVTVIILGAIAWTTFAPSGSNLCRITGQIHGKLRDFLSYANHELNSCMSMINVQRLEAQHPFDDIRDDGIVRALTKVGGYMGWVSGIKLIFSPRTPTVSSDGYGDVGWRGWILLPLPCNS